MRLTRREYLLLCGGGIAAAAARDLAHQWHEIARGTDGVVGAAALHLGSGARLSMNGGDRFPLASVCKLPMAMHMLALVDEGKLEIEESIEVLPRDVWSGVSEIEQHWPARRSYPLRELIELAVSKSDNTAEETLYRIGGRGMAFTTRLRQWKIDGLRIDRSERQCELDRNGVQNYPAASQWTDARVRGLIAKTPESVRQAAIRNSLADSRDTGTPDATVLLLARLFRGELLSTASTTRLIAILQGTTTFPTRIKGMLPPGTVVAHKTGSIGVTGFAIATNDSGVIFLPNGGLLAVSVYVKGSTRSDAERDQVIACIARAAFDRWRG